MGRMTVITGGERRRQWSEEDRARILAAIAEPGAVVADVARREEGSATFGFSPVIIAAAPVPMMSRDLAAQDATSGVIEVELKDVRVRIGAGASSSVIIATLKALRS